MYKNSAYYLTFRRIRLFLLTWLDLWFRPNWKIELRKKMVWLPMYVYGSITRTSWTLSFTSRLCLTLSLFVRISPFRMFSDFKILQSPLVIFLNYPPIKKARKWHYNHFFFQNLRFLRFGFEATQKILLLVCGIFSFIKISVRSKRKESSLLLFRCKFYIYFQNNTFTL